MFRETPGAVAIGAAAVNVFELREKNPRSTAKRRPLKRSPRLSRTCGTGGLMAPSIIANRALLQRVRQHRRAETSLNDAFKQVANGNAAHVVLRDCGFCRSFSP